MCLRVDDVERLEVIVGEAHARVVLRERLVAVRARARARGRGRVGAGVGVRVRLALTLTLTLTSMIVARRPLATSGQPISAATSPSWSEGDTAEI